MARFPSARYQSGIRAVDDIYGAGRRCPCTRDGDGCAKERIRPVRPPGGSPMYKFPRVELSA